MADPTSERQLSGIAAMLGNGLTLRLVISAPEIEAKLGEIMSALTDLQGAVAALNTSVSNEISAVTATIKAAGAGNAGAVSATDAEAIVTQLQGIQKTLDTETAALAPNPTPTPSPAP